MRWITILLALVIGETFAQGKPVRLVVPFGAGGAPDVIARLMAPPISENLGAPVVVDNRPGATGIIAAEYVKGSPPDGTTLFVADSAHFAISPALRPNLPYDPQKDFVPVTLVATSPLMLVVHPSIAAKSVQELVALAKANPGRLNFGSGGVGSTPHLSAELFKSAAGINAVHVPYKGGAPALNDLVGGQLSFMIENVPGTMPFVKSGKLRALAITSAQRSPLEPALPTMAESGVPGYEVVGWQGLFAVAGTPPEIVARLQAEVGKVLRLPEVRERLAALGAEPVGSTPEEFGAFIRAERTRWGAIIREKGIRSE